MASLVIYISSYQARPWRITVNYDSNELVLLYSNWVIQNITMSILPNKFPQALKFLYLPYLPVLTFYSLKIGPKNCRWLIHGSKTEIKKSSGQIFHVTIVCTWKEILWWKITFSRKFFPRNRKNLLIGSKIGGWLIHWID